MKRTIIAISVLLIFLPGPQAFPSEAAEEIFEEFAARYESLEPPSARSSVNTDYKIGQAALASYYTTRILSLMYKQNEEILSRFEEIIRKHDEILRQNEEIIKLLSRSSEERIKGAASIPETGVRRQTR